MEDPFILPDNPDAPLCVGSSLRWTFDKGAVDDQGDVIRQCDHQFLLEILLIMERGYENVLKHLSLNLDDISRAIQDTSRLFVEISREIRRLQRYQGLYPSQNSIKTFIIHLKSKLSTNHKLWTRVSTKIGDEHFWARLEKSEYLIELWIKTPTYQYDLKPWQQFLNEGAPGSGINAKAKFLGKVPESDDFDYSEITTDSSFQIIPPGGMAIWANWFNHINELERRIKMTIVPERFKCADPKTATMRTKKEVKELAPMLFRRETIHFDFEPNLWKPEGSGGDHVFSPDLLPFFDTIIGMKL
ncbi:hypothetical protein BGW36DRAFT_393982 [Talaromyces proteolyticus]|uniref:Uncharacterized protein n=1 Tax=Talaromyces proteolyticus TaxID=1131652 RepID=A0AAD4L355_9EURO|nr:uncharacterized protein BGW36DRAFT_393982 [Talaromyces proteolyticus]KAH8703734.1 hypothetical protein BGW36DRAFT_393982 [Talaromyces proteolyticus]